MKVQSTIHTKRAGADSRDVTAVAIVTMVTFWQLRNPTLLFSDNSCRPVGIDDEAETMLASESPAGGLVCKEEPGTMGGLTDRRFTDLGSTSTGIEGFLFAI